MTDTAGIFQLANALPTLVAVGDVHGKFGELGFRIKSRYHLRDCVVCLCGDIGMGFHKRGYYDVEFTKLNKIAKDANCVIIGVRGNHDDPAYFDGAFGRSNVLLVPDYTVIQAGNRRVLFVGGGISIDRKHRRAGVDYWEGEPPVHDEAKLLSAMPADVVITHTSPPFVEPKTKNGLMGYARHDQALLQHCAMERGVMGSVYDRMSEAGSVPKWWVYGHFHMSYGETVGDTKFRVVDELEFFEIPNR